MGRSLLAGAALAVTLVVGRPAAARTVRDQPYSFATTWNAVVRLLHVDFGFPITERDADSGYLTFSYREGARAVPGSVEIVRTQVDGSDTARVIVSIPLMPTYVEAMIQTRLGRKLREEFGDPPAPRRPPPAAPPAAPPTTPDAGTSSPAPAAPSGD